MSNRIILIRPHDTWVTVALDGGCGTAVVGEAELHVSGFGCPTVEVTCTPGPCGQTFRTYTEVPVPSVVLRATPTGCGEARFNLTPEFRALGLGRFKAVVKACGRLAQVGLQVVDKLIVKSTSTGYSFQTTPYVDGTTVLGELAVFTNCMIPSGWAPVCDPDGEVLGYARWTASMGFCKPHTLTTCPTRVVYLK